MKNRIRLFEFTEFLQATILKICNDKEIDAIKVTVYGYTPDLKGHKEFSYEILFKNELDRDLTFDEITLEKLSEDIKRIIGHSEIPILI